MIKAFKDGILKHGYLFITAAWLYTISFVLTNYISFNASPGSVKKRLEGTITAYEKDFNNILDNDAVVEDLLKDGSNANKVAVGSKKFGVFTYTLNDLGNPLQVYWNTNSMAVNPKDLKREDGSYAVEYPNGIFELIKTSRQYKGSTYIIAGLIPFHWNYFIQNTYLQKKFEGLPWLDEYYKVSKDGAGVPIKNSTGQILFHINQVQDVDTDQPTGLSIALRVIAIILSFVFIHAIAKDISEKRSFIAGLIFFVVVIFIVRLCSYVFPFPFHFRNYTLFFSGIYGSNIINKSLGDLLINITLLFWIIAFIKYNNLRLWKTPFSGNKKWMHVLSITCLCLLPVITYEFVELIRTLVVDSTISFDVTNFFSLNIYTVISFLVLCLIILCYYNLSHLLLLPAIRMNYSLFVRLCVIAVFGLLYIMMNIHAGSIDLKIITLLWLAVFLMLMEVRSNDYTIRIIRSSFFLFWVIFFSASITLLVITQNSQVEMKKRKATAERLALQTDPQGENLFSFATTDFSKAFDSTDFSTLNNETINRRFKDSLLKENFSGYLSKYDTRIYTFDSSASPLYNDDSVSYYALKSILNNRGKETRIPDLYYYENMAEKFTYIYEHEIKNRQDTSIGYLFIVARPKLYRSESLFPELFRQENNISTDVASGYSYALYSKQKLIANYNDYSLSDTLTKKQLPSLEFETRKRGDNSELWYDAGKAKIVVLVKKNNWFAESLTFFAYVFTTFIVAVVLFHFCAIVFRSQFQWKNIRAVFNFNIRTQIQSTIIFISLFSFIVIGIVTISFFISRYDRNNRERLSKNIQVIANEVEKRIKNSLMFEEVTESGDNVLNSPNGVLEKTVISISEEHNAEVNIYDKSGNLRASTQPMIYSKQILSNKMQPAAFYNLRYDRRLVYVQDEAIGNFTYLSAYIPIRETNGDVAAYLNIPYLNTESELNQEISNFLVTLISLNAFIFLLAGAIAMLLTNRITSSFLFITNRMKEINLRKLNEEIVWNRNDEIGVLVKEYNKMVHKLEESAHALAQSEREDAWREMARQVAHEIKNPLTPMKLSIQYLQKAIDNNAANVKELSRRVADTLIEQIEQLTKIAGDFSQFANIGSNMLVERFDITDVLQSVISLYKTDSRLYILWDREDSEYYINADKVQLNRLFTNLIKNAIEASMENNPVRIMIRQYASDGFAIIAIQDYGVGIPTEMQPKIFVPNFTTKSSGTGLGLAICKAIVEKANGHIWFETQESIGTTFYVSIPLSDEVVEG